MYSTILNTKKESDGTIVHSLNTGEILRYSAIRGGVCWPLKERKPYYCIIGEQWTPLNALTGERQRGKLVFMDEADMDMKTPQTGFGAFVRKLTDSISVLGCEILYTSLHDMYRDYLRVYSDYMSKMSENVGNCTLETAPFVDNFMWGIELCNDVLIKGRLELPEQSIARNQLKELSSGIVRESPELLYHGVNGLRYVVAGYNKYPPVELKIHIPQYNHPEGLAWMA